MGLIIKLLAMWGLADSLWMSLRPKQWSSFWGVVINEVGEKPSYARALAGLQFAVCMWMLKRK
jgi:hypothetical protein